MHVGHYITNIASSYCQLTHRILLAKCSWSLKHGCNLCFQYARVHPSKIIIICMEAATLKCGIPYLFLWNVWSNLMEEISFLWILITFIIWSDWQPLPVPFQNLFFIRSIRLSTVYMGTYPRVGACLGHYNNKYLIISVIAHEMLRYIHVRVHACTCTCYAMGPLTVSSLSEVHGARL